MCTKAISSRLAGDGFFFFMLRHFEKYCVFIDEGGHLSEKICIYVVECNTLAKKVVYTSWVKSSDTFQEKGEYTLRE
jgi:hypothetical protein